MQCNVGSYFLNVCNGQNYIERQSTGDIIYAAGLDCTLHKATSIGNGKCFCGSSTTYYTDQNNVSECFRGRGEEELGCTVFSTQETQNNILTLSPGVFQVHFLNSEKPQCLPTFKQLLIWQNVGWIPYNPNGLVGPTERTIPNASGKPVKQFGLLWLSITDAAKLTELRGRLFRFIFTLCGVPSCFMFKYEGRQSWEPSVISTTSTTTTTTTTTTTRIVSPEATTTTTPATTKITKTTATPTTTNTTRTSTTVITTPEKTSTTVTRTPNIMSTTTPTTTTTTKTSTTATTTPKTTSSTIATTPEKTLTTTPTTTKIMKTATPTTTKTITTTSTTLAMPKTTETSTTISDTSKKIIAVGVASCIVALLIFIVVIKLCHKMAHTNPSNDGVKKLRI